MLGVFVQVYLIGSYIFGAGDGALDAHKSVGFTTTRTAIVAVTVPVLLYAAFVVFAVVVLGWD